MNEQKLDALLKRMPDIASAVNSFQSEAIQHEAFLALIEAYAGSPPRAARAPVEEAEAPDTGESSGDGSETPKSTTRGRKQVRKQGGSKEGFKFARDLDLRPQGKTSFTDFIADKQPRSNEDKYAVTVYWLKEVLQLPAVSADHVGTVFRLIQGWRESKDVRAALRVTATRKGTIDTANPEDIRVTPHGRNFVDHDLPHTKKGR